MHKAGIAITLILWAMLVGCSGMAIQPVSLKLLKKEISQNYCSFDKCSMT
jgi:hypothetical protein